MIKTNKNPLWGGHFDNGPSEIMEKINESISFDKKLYEYDIKGSIAHCDMLVKKKILTQPEGKMIVKGLNQIKKEIYRGKFVFKTQLEDIHMNIESRLHDIIGDVAGKLHTARSRNDQVATDFRLYVRDALDVTEATLKNLQKALIKRANEHSSTIMPGFTHLQTAQPVTLGHHLMAYVEMFGRDRSRVKDARNRMNECPLGAAALAGTSFPIDRKATAKSLDFKCATANSIDSVSDRDFALEFLSTASIISMHLSRLAEEVVIWSSADFNFIKLSDAFTSGSSIMPQKRNPDAAELVRAKSGRIYGSLFALLTVMKGLTLTYSKDMQEDKEPVFDAAENLSLCINAMAGMITDMNVNKEKMKEAAGRGYSTATDLADWLVQNLGIPFRQCHSIAGRVVKLAEERGCKLEEIPLEDMQQIEPKITEGILKVLSVESSVKSRTSYGGTSPENVEKAIKEAKKKYEL
ncbi:MAG: argininosuccinate lyase [Rickettsiales bacterium]|nr:argininosuccinate lyase [Pseudomonadota bacterium]MDA0966811.1 argininosuccinate lyase [Pseudomonadota bacterium]MDG4543483.1 argininosuccinate lyase [Rickettsiales bacterium]MDG4546123.1 argininosuccinate lyase [Rickettsiales bacterium]MDG4547596.1 argininosuccinate lyase [Rickettsiales bacterium]